MEFYLQILKKCPLFETIEEADLLRMLNCLGAKIQKYNKKSIILSEGTPTKHIGIILDGKAQMTQIDYYGNRSILSTMGNGDIFAEEFACADSVTLPVNVVAHEPCTVMLIESSHILHTCSNNCAFHQSLIYNLMKDLATKTVGFHQKIEVTSKRTTREKLLTYLMLRSKEVGSADFFIPFDRQELADYLQVDRSGLSAEISKLRAEGVLKSNKNHFVLL